MMGLSVVKSASKSASLQPVRMLAAGAASFIRSTTLTTRIFRLRQVSPQDRHGGQGLQRRHVAAQAITTSGSPPWSLLAQSQMPMPSVQCAHGRVHGQPLRQRVLAGHHDVDVVAAAQAVVHHRQQAVGIRRQVDADDVGLLVDHVVDEAGVLVGEAVVVLPPDVRGQQVVERGDLRAATAVPA